MERNGPDLIKRFDSAERYDIFPWRDFSTGDGGNYTYIYLFIELFGKIIALFVVLRLTLFCIRKRIMQ